MLTWTIDRFELLPVDRDDGALAHDDAIDPAALELHESPVDGTSDPEPASFKAPSSGILPQRRGAGAGASMRTARTFDPPPSPAPLVARFLPPTRMLSAAGSIEWTDSARVALADVYMTGERYLSAAPRSRRAA